MEFYELDTVFGDGEYLGKTILEVLELDPNYIQSRINNDSNFYLMDETIDEINNGSFGIKISQEMIDLMDLRLLNEEDDFEDDDDMLTLLLELEKDDYMRSQEREFGYSENIHRNPHYDDGLDLDQQSIEF